MSKSKCLSYFIGGTVLLANLYYISVHYLIPWKSQWVMTDFKILVDNMISVLSVFPRGLPLLVSFFENGSTYLEGIILWQIVMIICGIGILRFNNLARKIFVILCGIHILLFLISRVIGDLLYRQESATPILIGIIYELSWILPLIYMYLLNRKSVLKFFK